MQFILDQIRLGFHDMHGDPDLPGEIQRTLRLAFESTAIAMLLGVLPAYLIGVSRSRAARWGLVVANAGLGLPAVAVGIFLIFLLPAYTPSGNPWSHTMAGMVYAQTILAFPIVVALSAAAIRGLPDGMLDQARAFGARGSRLALFAYREAKIGVLSAVILALGSAIAEVGAVTVIGGNTTFSTTTLSSEILNDVQGGAAGGASGVPGGLGGAVEHAIIVLAVMMVLAAFLTIVQQWGELQHRRQIAEPSSEPSPRDNARAAWPLHSNAALGRAAGSDRVG